MWLEKKIWRLWYFFLKRCHERNHREKNICIYEKIAIACLKTEKDQIALRMAFCLMAFKDQSKEGMKK